MFEVSRRLVFFFDVGRKIIIYPGLYNLWKVTVVPYACARFHFVVSTRSRSAATPVPTTRTLFAPRQAQGSKGCHAGPGLLFARSGLTATVVIPATYCCNRCCGLLLSREAHCFQDNWVGILANYLYRS